MDLSGATQAVVDRLLTAGIAATADERDVNPPCVFVAPPTVTWRFRRGDFDARFALWAVVPDSGRNIALANLGPLVTAAAEALDLQVVTAESDDLFVPDRSGPLPAYRIVFTQKVRAQSEVTTS